jgi:hypothetical protein
MTSIQYQDYEKWDRQRFSAGSWIVSYQQDVLAKEKAEEERKEAEQRRREFMARRRLTVESGPILNIAKSSNTLQTQGASKLSRFA